VKHTKLSATHVTNSRLYFIVLVSLSTYNMMTMSQTHSAAGHIAPRRTGQVPIECE